MAKGESVYNLFYPSKGKFQPFDHVEFVICKCFQFGPVSNSVIFKNKANKLKECDNNDILNPLPDDKILDRSNLNQSAGNNFKFDENSRKFSKRVENTVGKGEIARYEQFLLFALCFQKTSFLEVSKGVVVWEWVNPFPNNKF